jgi:hypothetical protein
MGSALNSSNSYNVRNVNSSGTLNNNNARNGNNGFRPDSVKTLDLLTASCSEHIGSPLRRRALPARMGKYMMVDTLCGLHAQVIRDQELYAQDIWL